ncbi:MAG TPA: hypothetical protein PLY40_06530 [Bacillota bacterium]|nr:hypothetical protein [Bacillota bacterium]
MRKLEQAASSWRVESEAILCPPFCQVPDRRRCTLRHGHCIEQPLASGVRLSIRRLPLFPE